MKTCALKTQKNKRPHMFGENSLEQSGNQSSQFVDNRSEAIAQMKLAELANNSLQVKQLKTTQGIANNGSRTGHASQLLKTAGSKSAVIQCINSSDLTISQNGSVAKAPSGIGANRFSDAGSSIHKVSLADFPGGAGTIVAGNDGGARIDKQGNFDADGKSWANIQVQANATEGGANYADLTYPQGTSGNQKGTSFAEVHVDNRIVASEKEDVLNRGKRLLKRGLMYSRGERNTYPRPRFRITF